METKSNPPVPKPSSTVMVVRPLEASNPQAGFEIFMVRRHSKSRFLPDRFVFPGGRLEEQDSRPAALARLYRFDRASKTSLFRDLPGEGAHYAAIPLTPEQEAGMYVAAFRELFEEAGLLLAVEEASGQPPNWQAEQALVDRLTAFRRESQSNHLDFIAMLEQEKLLLDFEQLTYFSHWITPGGEPYRFDARFFLAQAPLDQLAESDNFETHDGLWISPQLALERMAANEFSLIYPTIMHLEWLSRYRSIAELLQAARAKTVVAAMPNMFQGEAGPIFELPADVIERW